MALIVVAEDDAGTMRLIEAALHLQGHEVLTANNGQSAWMTIRQYRPDLVVSDINMPGVNGFDLLKEIRADETLKGLPVLMVTAEARKEDIVAAAQGGASGYIVKPFTKATLEEKVQKILQKAAAK